MTRRVSVAKVRRLATEMRSALEALAQTLSSSQIKDFPRGACGDASILLAKYLEDEGCGAFDYCCADYEQGSHTWLQSGSVAVDISADQFGKDKVIVSRNSAWHEDLRESGSCEGLIWHSWWNAEYEDDYRKLVAYIMQHRRAQE